MTTVKTTKQGLDYLIGILKEKPKTITRAVFWKIPHTNSGREDICLKIGRYNRTGFVIEVLENENPKSELTLDSEEFQKLLEFLSENYEPFKKGVKEYIPIDVTIEQNKIEHLQAIFSDPNKEKVLEFIVNN